MPHHLIFEGAELSGKSWVMSQIYNYLEKKHNRSGLILDGCHWFNCDVGLFGTKHSRPIIGYYVKIFEEIKNKNIIVEKFHLSDVIYNIIYYHRTVDYTDIEKKLRSLKFKIILITFPEDEKIIKKRIQGRLRLYPHYERILKNPRWYIRQQREYLKAVKKSRLPYFIEQTKILPDNKLIEHIFDEINEKYSKRLL